MPVQNHTVMLPVAISNGSSATATRDDIVDTINAVTTTGTTSTDNFTSTASSQHVDMVCLQRGAPKSTPSAGTSPFTVAVTTPGSSTAYEVTRVTCVSASSVKPNDYFMVSTINHDVMFWFIVNGAGTEPSATADKKVPIEIDGTESANALAAKINDVTDYVLFAVPDKRGLFTRGANSADNEDLFHRDPGTRNANPKGESSSPGSLQLYRIKSHSHNYNNAIDFFSAGAGGTSVYSSNSSIATSSTGSDESRPTNIAMNFIIVR